MCSTEEFFPVEGFGERKKGCPWHLVIEYRYDPYNAKVTFERVLLYGKLSRREFITAYRCECGPGECQLDVEINEDYHQSRFQELL